MSCFTEMRVLATGTADPTKHVNFVQGMVLGEDEFKQEFAYLSGRDQWLARDLIGYGTVRGLKVHTDWDGTKGPRIYVHPGVAVTPAGQLVCVPSPQCANLNEWLARHEKEVQAQVGSPPPNPLRLYLLLCYRDCRTDNVPIPGEPCRSEDQLVQPSRLRDDFALELRVERPEQREERALRAFGELLRRVDMSDSAVTSIPLDQFLDELRRATAAWFSAPDSPPLEGDMPGSPPSAMQVHPKDAHKYLRAAFHLWTTDLRPKWFARWYGCAPSEKEPAPFEDCVLLAEVQVGLLFDPARNAYQAVDGSLPAVMDDDRPYLLHLRMLQEWLIGGASGMPTGSESLGTGPGNMVISETTFGLSAKVGGSSDYARADHTHGTPALPVTPTAGSVVTDGRSFGQGPPSLGNMSEYARADHSHGTPTLPAMPEAGNVVTDGRSFGQGPPSLGGLSAYARADHSHGTPALPALGGDIAGTIDAATVNRVRGVEVFTAGTVSGHVLTFLIITPATATTPAITRWEARAAPTPTLGGEVIGPANNNRISRILGVPLPVLTAALQDGQGLAFNQVQRAWVPQPYFVVAAARVRFTLQAEMNRQTATVVGTAYNGLTPIGVYESTIGGFRFTFTGGIPFTGEEPTNTHIVTVTPAVEVPGLGEKRPFHAYFSGFFRPDPLSRVLGGFTVAINADPGAAGATGGLMIEVSRMGIG